MSKPLALLSVSDKTGIVDLGRGLVALGYEVLSTGGTARALEAGGVAVTRVSDHTGAPEVFDGRVKTLHPRIHGGILGRRGQDDTEAAANGIRWIDLVAVNLYPFEATIREPGVTLAEGQKIVASEVGVSREGDLSAQRRKENRAEVHIRLTEASFLAGSSS